MTKENILALKKSRLATLSAVLRILNQVELLESFVEKLEISKHNLSA